MVVRITKITKDLHILNFSQTYNLNNKPQGKILRIHFI